MKETDKTEFEILVSAADATGEELDELTRQLLTELRDLNVESAQLVSVGQAPDGSKGDPITLGSIAVVLLPVVLPGVISLIQDWIARGKGRTVKFKGKGIEFEGTVDDLDKLLKKGEKKK